LALVIKEQQNLTVERLEAGSEECPRTVMPSIGYRTCYFQACLTAENIGGYIDLRMRNGNATSRSRPALRN
jgi:hypothetical protein